MESEVAAPSADKLVETYVKIRDAKRDFEREAEAKIAELDDQLGMIEAELLAICKAQGMDGIRTKAGTVSRRIKTRYWTNDWESLYDCISENDVYGLLEKRIHQTNMKQFIEENPSLIPKGLNMDSEYTVVVTRSKSNS